MSSAAIDLDWVRFPVELRPPLGFSADDPGTWPAVDGRIEYVGGKLLYMPPCADVQQDVVPSVVHELYGWAEAHNDFVVASNEAGMILGGEVRGADAAVWRRADAEPRTGHYRTRPPVLAVEVAGQDEGEGELRAKARWYLDHAVELVWVVLPETHEVIVIRAGAETRHGAGARLPETALLPGLAPEVSRFFAQLDPRRSAPSPR